MNVASYRAEWKASGEMLDRVESLPDNPDGFTVCPHLTDGTCSVSFDAGSAWDLKAKLTAARAYLRDGLGTWTDDVKSIRKREDTIYIDLGNDGPFYIAVRTTSEEVFKLFAKDGCEFKESYRSASTQELVCPV